MFHFLDRLLQAVVDHSVWVQVLSTRHFGLRFAVHLENGVVLPIQLQLRVNRVRRFWLDGDVASLEQNYQLSYQPLSERYVVKNLNSGEQDSFATLFSALNTMGRVVDLPIIDASLLDPDGTYEIAMRAVLDQNTLPGPLRLIAFWSSGFRLESKWYVWKLSD